MILFGYLCFNFKGNITDTKLIKITLSFENPEKDED